MSPLFLVELDNSILNDNDDGIIETVVTMDVTINGLDDMYLLTIALVVLKGGDIVGTIELYDGINRLENMELPLATVNIVEKDDFAVEVLVLVVGAIDVII